MPHVRSPAWIPSIAASAALALVLSGCFENLSGGTFGKSVKSSAQTAFTESPTANDIVIDGKLVGAYTSPTDSSKYGILVDLRAPLVTFFGETNLNSMLASVDSDPSMQSRPLTVRLPTYGIKMQSTFGAVAAGNNKQLRGVLNIRPGFQRVDLASAASVIPDSPNVVQMNNSNKTVITYGGIVEGDVVRQITALIPYTGANASFLPSVSNPNWGAGTPNDTPDGTVQTKLVRLSPAIAKAFANLIIAKPYGTDLYNRLPSDAFRSIATTYTSFALAVHYGGPDSSGSAPILAAYMIYLNPSNASGPEWFPFCHKSLNEIPLDITITPPSGTAVDIEFHNPTACDITNALSYQADILPAGSVVSDSDFKDPWKILTQTSYDGHIYASVKQMVDEAVCTWSTGGSYTSPNASFTNCMLSPQNAASPAPSMSLVIPPTAAINGWTFSAN